MFVVICLRRCHIIIHSATSSYVVSHHTALHVIYCGTLIDVRCHLFAHVLTCNAGTDEIRLSWSEQRRTVECMCMDLFVRFADLDCGAMAVVWNIPSASCVGRSCQRGHGYESHSCSCVLNAHAHVHARMRGSMHVCACALSHFHQKNKFHTFPPWRLVRGEWRDSFAYIVHRIARRQVCRCVECCGPPRFEQNVHHLRPRPSRRYWGAKIAHTRCLKHSKCRFRRWLRPCRGGWSYVCNASDSNTLATH